MQQKQNDNTWESLGMMNDARNWESLGKLEDYLDPYAQADLAYARYTQWFKAKERQKLIDDIADAVVKKLKDTSLLISKEYQRAFMHNMANEIIEKLKGRYDTTRSSQSI